MSAALLEGVWKRFGEVAALADVSFEVGEGSFLALLGPNGAGKTTAVSLLLGLRSPDRGRAALFGETPRRAEPRRRIGVTPQDAGFPSTVTVSELVALVAAHYSAPAAADELVERFGLVEAAGRKTGGLSGGEKRRLALALAFAGRPDLLILDEPTAGLDVESRRAAWRELRRFHHAGGAVLLTTHYLEEAERLAEGVVVLHRGRVVAHGRVDDVVESIGVTHVRFRAPALPELPGVVSSRRDGSTWSLACRDADAAVRELVRREIAFESLEVRPASLEEAFVSLTEGG